MNQETKEAATVHAFVSTPLTFGSLFTGIGGLDLGFERAGMVCKWQCEIDPFARKVLDKHWPEVPKHDDVRTFKPSHCDVVAGGFPCQDISSAGRQAGIRGERSGLFFELMRIVRQVGPRFVVLENVSALLHRGMETVLAELAESGFDAQWTCISAASIGAPHRRERVFIVAYPAGKRFDSLWDEARDSAKADVAQQSGWTWRGDLRRGTSGRVRLCPVGWDHRVGDGFPSGVDRSRLRGLGNAVVPQVAEYVARRILAAASSEC